MIYSFLGFRRQFKMETDPSLCTRFGAHSLVHYYYISAWLRLRRLILRLITKGYILVKLIALARYRNILGTLYSSFVSGLVRPED